MAGTHITDTTTQTDPGCGGAPAQGKLCGLTVHDVVYEHTKDIHRGPSGVGVTSSV